ncbi:MAG: glycosyl hydrolase-related protein [Verrucomicrobia bacterium]|nr:glycosyl hydrolase-related protein [Verrucomicrobiota bacterium]
MRTVFNFIFTITLLLAGGALPLATAADTFTRLTSLPAPKIVATAEEFPGGNFVATRLLDGNLKTEFASHGKGTNTFVEFDFGAPVRIGGFRHQDRNDPAIIAASELAFSDAAGRLLGKAQVTHVNQRAGVTFFALPEPVNAQRVRWRVTKLGSPHSTVGGAEIEFFAASKPEPSPRGIGIEALTVQMIDRKAGALVQPLRVTFDYPYAQPLKVLARVEGQEPRPTELKFGKQTLEYTIAAADSERTLNVAIEVAGQKVASRAVTLKPSRKLTVYVLPHSHTDIGYTAIQTDIEEKQINNLLQGLADARRTASYPPGARFVWNVEVMWAADLFLQRLAPKQRAEFFDAVKRGQVSLNGMYLNELTGLCRPEELLRLFRYATQLGERTGVPVDSAMISDVPGYTWGTVTAMAQAGIRYFSVAPNYLDRIGDILVQWENKPFWWVGPDGKSKVLVWIPYKGYAMSMVVRTLTPRFVDEYMGQLDKTAYPYDIAYMRWAGHGDNAVPDPAICEFVKEWNATHAWPRFVISSTSEAFRAFEKRHGDKLPQVRGDWTPYWEDGAGSSAAETAMNRASSERLAQAETLWAMLDPKRYPAKRFEEAWNNVLLYSEHTWGAYCSVSQPANPFTSNQWTIKQSYATVANLQSRQLLSDVSVTRPPVARHSVAGHDKPDDSRHGVAGYVDIFNTTSWPRSELVLIPHEITEGGNFVTDDQGQPIPAQRLASRELAMFVRDLPPFSGRRYTISKEGKASASTKLTANGAVIENDKLRIRLDEKTGGIVELRAAGIEANLADTASGHALNDYLYLIGDDLAALQRSGLVKITVRERGPLVTSLLVESDAPGCHKLLREIRLVAGADYVELLDTVDKKRLEAASYTAKEGKESVNIAFPFNIPGGDVRLDVPLGVIRPEHDQMPSACKNWLTAGRWADVTNRDYGVTWVTLDAPLVQVGGITATLLNSQTNPDGWLKKIEPTQKLYSWAMNNHWHTNYRAYQEGPVQFRFVLRPHRGRAGDAENARFATGFSQPLVATPARGHAPTPTPLLRVEPADVLVTALKPSDDGKAWIVRLFSAGGTSANAKLTWSKPAPKRVWLSNTSEKPLRKAGTDVAVPAWGVVTLRAER